MDNSENNPKIHQRVMAHGKKKVQERYKKHYHPDNPHHKKHLITDTVLSVIVLVLFLFSTFLIIFYRQAIVREKIGLDIVLTETSVESGQRLDFVVEIANNTGQELKEAMLSLPEAPNYVVSRTTPSMSDNRLFLGTLDAGEKVTVKIEGYALLDVNSSLRLNAVLEYEGPLGSNQQKLVSEVVSVSGSELEITLDLPEAIIANQPFAFKLNYQNFSEVTQFENVTIVPNWPPGWEIVESSVEIDEVIGTWEITSVGSLEKGSIEGIARLQTSDLDEAVVSFQYFAAPFGRPLQQGSFEVTLPVRYPNVRAEVNTNVATVAPGGSAIFTVSVKNEEDFPLRDVVAVFDLNSAIYQTRGLSTPLNSDGKLEVEIVSALGPGIEADVTQALSVRTQINPELAFGDGAVRIATPIEIRYEDPNGQTVVIPLKVHVLNLQSDLSIFAFARYYSVEGDQIGRGPVPPKVGETTKYWVFIQLTNSLNRVQSIVVNARLQPGVNYTGRSSVTAGQGLRFTGDGLMTWSLDSMPDYKTDFNQARFGAAFEVSVTPTADQHGEVLDLVRDIEVQAKDGVTGSILSDAVNLVTSELVNDSYAKDQGKVEF